MVKMTFGNHKTIRLTLNDYNELISVYGREVALTYIQRVDDFIKSTGRVYPSHFATIKEWLVKDGYAEVAKTYGLRQIFIEFNGNNKDEIIKLRKEWKPTCPICNGEMVFLKMLDRTFKVGETPASLVKCTGCVNYGVGEVYLDKDGARMLGQGFSSNPNEWDLTWAETLAQLEREENGN